MFILPQIGLYLEENDISLSPNDWARITDMDYKAVVVDEPGSKGKIVVTERITFDVHAASRLNGFWELWRDLCEDYVDGLKVHYKVNSVKQILPNGQEIPWEESPKLYWDDSDYISSKYGPGKWYHSHGPYDESRRLYECVFFYIDDVYREEMVFEIEYEMYNAVLRYGDCSDLYISMYSGDTIKYLESFNAEILIPNKDMPSIGNYKVKTYGTNANNFQVEESKTKNPGYYTFFFELTEDELAFKPYNEYIEFELVAYGEDKHIFAEHASKNDYYNDAVLEEIWDEQETYENEPSKYKSIKITLLVCCLIAAVIVFFFGKKKIDNLNRRYPFYSSDQPDAIYRDIPSDLDPKFAAALVACKDRKPEDDAGVYSSILLSLARKQYIELKENEQSNDVIITLTNKEEGDGPFESLDMFDPFDPREPLEPLTPSESYYFFLIKRHAKYGSISMSSLQKRISTDYEYTNGFVSNMNRVVVDCGIRESYFQKADYLEPKKKLSASSIKHWIMGFVVMLANFITYQTRLDFVFGGLFILGAAYIATGIYLKVQSHKYVLLTAQGEREYNKWRGLYNFLRSDTLINERTVVELPLWEKYLVYATAFGISEKVIAAIKIRCPAVLEQSKSIVNSNYCRSGRIRTSGRSFHSSVRSGYRGYHSSSNYGGGFGYGGGGRGGGGGGGGH